MTKSNKLYAVVPETLERYTVTKNKSLLMRLVLLVNLLTFGFAAHLAIAAEASITVQSATYAFKTAAPPANPGKVCQSNPKNMTTKVAAVCNGMGNCDYTVPLPAMEQDPAFGCFKSFQIKYTCSNPSVVYRVEDGGINSESATTTLKLTCSQNGIVINEASYGENCKTNLTGNRTLPVMNQCQGSKTCNYTVSAQNNGDPAVGCAKTFDVQYQCIGSSSLQKSAHIVAEADTQTVNLNCPSTAPTPPAALSISDVNMFVYTNYRTTNNTLFSVNSKFTVTNNTATAIPAGKIISVDIYAVNTNVVSDATPKTKIGDVAVTLPALEPGVSHTWVANTSYVANNIGRMITRTSPSPQANYYTFVLIRDQAIDTGGISIQTNQLPPAAMIGN